MINFLFTHTPLVFFISPLWRDEAFSVFMAKLPLFQLLTATARDSNPPLYYLLLKIWMIIGRSSEIAIRSLSLVSFVFTLYGMYLILEHVYHWPLKKSWIWIVLAGINPLLLYFAFEARMYMLSACLGLYSWYFLLKKMKKSYIIVTVAALFTHYFLFFLVFGQLLYVIISKQKKKYVFLPFFAFLLTIPWLIFVFIVKPGSHTSFWTSPLELIDILRLPVILYAGYEKAFTFSDQVLHQLNPMIIILTILLWIILFSITLRHKKNAVYREAIYIALCWIAIPTIITIAISFFIPLLIPRYLLFVTIGFLCFIPFLFSLIPHPFKLILIILFFIITFQYNMYQILYREKEDPAFTASIHEIQSIANRADIIYLPNELDYFPALYYAPNRTILIYNKTYDEVPWYVGKALMNPGIFTQSFPRFPTRAFVVESNGQYHIYAQQ